MSAAALYQFSATRLDGSPLALADYQGQVLLLVNTASQCGFTPQFGGLEELHKAYGGKGLVVLGFPSNDFSQESGDNKQIADFCENTFGVKFPMFAKSRVAASAGAAANPLIADLAKRTGQWPRWNFHKYLIAPDGRTVHSFATGVEPDASEVMAKPAPASEPA